MILKEIEYHVTREELDILLPPLKELASYHNRVSTNHSGYGIPADPMNSFWKNFSRLYAAELPGSRGSRRGRKQPDSVRSTSKRHGASWII